ncbi:MAG: DUF6624 domain-containing protein [Zavarzinella sp.]
MLATCFAIAFSMLLAPPANGELRKELLEMQRKDQAARAAMLQAFEQHGIRFETGKPVTEPQKLAVVLEEAKKLKEIDAVHTERMKEILKKHGWPGKALVGIDGAHAAWLLVQHADSDSKFQEQCLKLMQKAPKGEVDPKDIAYLTDRVLVAAGKPQRYGTQLRADFQPMPIEDESQVDQRRTAIGLPPLAEYLKTAYEDFKKMSQAPRK